MGLCVLVSSKTRNKNINIKLASAINNNNKENANKSKFIKRYNNDNELTKKYIDKTDNGEKPEKFLTQEIDKQGIKANDLENNVGDQIDNSMELDYKWYSEADHCSEKIKLKRFKKIDNTGDCLFHSLIVAAQLKMNIKELKRRLRKSLILPLYKHQEKAYSILSTPKAWADRNIIYIFSQKFKKNICVHVRDDKYKNNNEIKISYVHYICNKNNEFIHLHLQDNHYTPLLKESKYDELMLREKRLVTFILI